MESKNVKIIDEHNIDRDANIICGFKLDSSDYVLYWIERDEDNANLFVSKLLKNNDNTFNMLNIEDSMERNNVNNLVKEMVTLAVKSNDDKSVNEITLANGTKISLFSVLFNRDQSINVTKTYVSTVKKAVAKVSSNYYGVSVKEENNDNIFNDIFVDNKPEEPKNEELVMPEVIETPSEIKPQENNEVNTDDIMNSFVENLNIEENKANENIVSEEKKESDLTSPISNPNPIPVVPSSNQNIIENKDVVNDKNDMNNEIGANNAVNNDNINISFNTPEPTKIDSVIPVQPSPIIQEVPKVNEPVVEQTVEPISAVLPEINEEPKLVFDASHETNFNNAIKSETADNVTVSNDVNSLREFGQNDNVNISKSNINAIPNAIPNAALDNSQPKVLTKTLSKGYANFKIFAVIGVVVFIIACAFMGYEVYNYINLVK